jgi:hypothetical protein
MPIKNTLRDCETFEQKRANIPPWPTDPEARAELVAVAREIEDLWQAEIEFLGEELAR